MTRPPCSRQESRSPQAALCGHSTKTVMNMITNRECFHKKRQAGAEQKRTMVNVCAQLVTADGNIAVTIV